MAPRERPDLAVTRERVLALTLGDGVHHDASCAVSRPHEALRALVLALLAWAIVAPGLAYRRWRYRVDDRVLVAERGVVFHLMGALSEFGKLGLVCIGDNPQQSKFLYRKCVGVLNQEVGLGQAPGTG